jgi:hypothetical protein
MIPVCVKLDRYVDAVGAGSLGSFFIVSERSWMHWGPIGVAVSLVVPPFFGVAYTS